MKKQTIILLGTVSLLVIGYGLTSSYYYTHFFPNTRILDYDVSGKTVVEADSFIKSELENSYGLSVKGRDFPDEWISGQDIGYQVDISTKPVLEEQESIKWILSLNKDTIYELGYNHTFNQEKLMEETESLSALQNENMKAPEDAYIDYIAGTGYQIIEENDGTQLIKDKTYKTIIDAVDQEKTEVDLDLSECYTKPGETKESVTLNEMLNKLNMVASSSITYEIGSVPKILDADTFHQWIITDDLGNISLNQEMLETYVKSLAKETDTAYTKRDFMTTSGTVVNVEGPYGYRIDREAEAEQLKDEILSGTQTEREPIYSMVGAIREENDYGNTYVEIDLTNQMVYLYVGGDLIQSSKCVTGNIAKGHTTPPGIYPLTYKQKDAVLRGPGYASPVKFWMPFNGGIGLHDASWRSSFGGNIYKTNGSHGCVNLPYDMAKTLYENVYKGMPIICYN